jgi:flagellar basal body-associated protein FliL
MARKAKLDILEIPTEEPPEDPESVRHPPEPESESQPQPLRMRLHKKLIVTCAIVTGVCFIAGGGLFFWMRTGKKDIASLPGKQRPFPVADVARHNVANLDNFVIDYQGQGDAVRIVTFALAVELNEPVKKEAVENQAELRGDIYMLSKKRSLGSLLSPEERGTLRNEIAAELDKRLGAGAVKAVYFTRFCIL